jgi:hypothetical protein
MLKTIMPEQNVERAKQAANYGMDWMRQLMEESLNQTRAIFDGFLSTARKTADSFDQQAAEVRERSMSMATDTLSNSIDFAHRALNVSAVSETAVGPLAAADRIREQAGAGGRRKQQNARGNHCARSVRDGEVHLSGPGGSLPQIASRVRPAGLLREYLSDAPALVGLGALMLLVVAAAWNRAERS